MVRKFKWVVVAVLIAALVTVFWVLPAAGGGPVQPFYLQNCTPSLLNMTGTYYTMSKQSPPPECSGTVQIPGYSYAAWIADVPVPTETTFAPGDWSGYLEFSSTWGYFAGWLAVGWIELPCGTFHPWLNQTFNLTSSPGLVPLPDHPVEGWSIPAWKYLAAKMGVSDSNSVYLQTGGHTCYVGAPRSDPPYGQLPGLPAPQVPTFSHWGMIGLAGLVALFLAWSLMRRRTGLGSRGQQGGRDASSSGC